MPCPRACRSLLLVAAALLLPVTSRASDPDQAPPPKPTWFQRFLGIKPDLSGGWLYVGYKNDSNEGLYFAVSKDASHWEAVNFDRPVLWQQQRGELMRDPFLQRTPEGDFRMLWTWSADTLGSSTSTDLIHWSKQTPLPVAELLPTARDVNAPATYYDPEKKDWLVLFSAAPQGNSGDHLYATTTADFKQFQPARPFAAPGDTVASATLIANMQHWSDTTAKMTLPEGLRHGSFLRLTTSEYNLLHNYHGTSDSAFDK